MDRLKINPIDSPLLKMLHRRAWEGSDLQTAIDRVLFDGQAFVSQYVMEDGTVKLKEVNPWKQLSPEEREARSTDIPERHEHVFFELPCVSAVCGGRVPYDMTRCSPVTETVIGTCCMCGVSQTAPASALVSLKARYVAWCRHCGAKHHLTERKTQYDVLHDAVMFTFTCEHCGHRQETANDAGGPLKQLSEEFESAKAYYEELYKSICRERNDRLNPVGAIPPIPSQIEAMKKQEAERDARHALSEVLGDALRAEFEPPSYVETQRVCPGVMDEWRRARDPDAAKPPRARPSVPLSALTVRPPGTPWEG